jgi:hypothetical protein
MLLFSKRSHPHRDFKFETRAGLDCSPSKAGPESGTIVADFREACLPALASLFAAVAIDTTTMPTAFTARFRLLLGEAKKAYGKNACRRDYRRAFDDRLYHVEFSRSAHGGLLEVGCHVRKFVRR